MISQRYKQFIVPPNFLQTFYAIVAYKRAAREGWLFAVRTGLDLRSLMRRSRITLTAGHGFETGAVSGARTRDLRLGKPLLYQLSYYRK